MSDDEFREKVVAGSAGGQRRYARCGSAAVAGARGCTTCRSTPRTPRPTTSSARRIAAGGRRRCRPAATSSTTSRRRRSCSGRPSASSATRASRPSRTDAGGASSSRSRSGTTSTRRALSTTRSCRCCSETQIYRIDHYLGKETVQNILAFRFGNGIFEPIWNRRYIDHVQITAAETVGVEGRGGYYEGSGALRDMVPNHLFQLITLTAMEPPISFEAERRPRRAGEDPARDPAVHARGRAASHGARAVRRAGRSTARRQRGLPRRGQGRRPTRRPRPSSP